MVLGLAQQQRGIDHNADELASYLFNSVGLSCKNMYQW